MAKATTSHAVQISDDEEIFVSRGDEFDDDHPAVALNPQNFKLDNPEPVKRGPGRPRKDAAAE